MESRETLTSSAARAGFFFFAALLVGLLGTSVEASIPRSQLERTGVAGEASTPPHAELALAQQLEHPACRVDPRLGFASSLELGFSSERELLPITPLNGTSSTINTPFQLPTLEDELGEAKLHAFSELSLQKAKPPSLRMGRFLSPDKLGGDVINPQSWNRYTYALNNPIRFVDPFGLSVEDANGIDECPDGNCPPAPVPLPTPKVDITVTGKDPGPPKPGVAEALQKYGSQILPGFLGNDMTRYYEHRAEQFRMRGDLIGALGYGIDRLGANLSPVGIFMLALQPESLPGPLSITFGHGARHLAGTGLSEAAVNAAIGAQIRSELAGASMSGSFWGRITIQGQTLVYRAFTLADGTVHVGTYYKP